jgi:hypothetical protein
MFKKAMIIVAVVLVGFCIVVALQPSGFKITRSTSVSASPATVFAEVNEIKHWQNWSPWEKLDPNMKKTYEGPDAGVGASWSWSGNSKVGEGKSTIVESQAPDRVALRLDFTKPMKATNHTEFLFQPQEQGTMVTWTMTGEVGFIGKMFHLFMDVDKMVGGDFEKGLAHLKSIAEAKSTQ